MIEVTRRYRFPAAHVLCQPALSDEGNRRLYGKCANPNGHGHDYGVEVTVTGRVDPRGGRVVEPDLLDAIFDERVRARFSHRHLNDDPLFATRVPTAENFAAAIYDRLAGPVRERSGAILARVRVTETRKNSFSYGVEE